jgi:hypothetical protein
MRKTAPVPAILREKEYLLSMLPGVVSGGVKV